MPKIHEWRVWARAYPTPADTLMIRDELLDLQSVENPPPCSAYRMVLRGEPAMVVMGLGLSEEQCAEIEAILDDGRPVALPQEVLRDLVERTHEMARLPQKLHISYRDGLNRGAGEPWWSPYVEE